MRLLAFKWPKQPNSGLPSICAGLHVDRGPGRVFDAPDRTVVAGSKHAFLDVVRVDDQARRVGQHLAGERELVRPGLPRRGHTPVEHPVGQQASRNAGVALHRSEVAVAVLPPDRQSRDEMVEDEVVQDDHSRPSSQRIDDPAVRFRIVADVVERDVGGHGARASAPHDHDLHELLERRQQQRGVVGDPRPLWRQRRVIRDPHASRRAIVSSQDTRRAISFPACPHAFASSTWSRSHEQASARAAACGSITSPVLTIGDDLERAAGVRRRDDRLLGEKRLVGNHAEVLVHRRVVDGEAACVEPRELFLVDAPGEACAPVEAVLAGDVLEPLAVWTVADDHAVQRRVGRKRVEQQLVPLGAVESPHRKHEVVVALRPVRQLLRWVRHHLRGDSGRSLQAVGDIARSREHLPRLAQRDAIEALNRPARRALLRALTELAELRAIELVGLPKLVQQPHHLVGMTNGVRRKLRRDHELDRASVRFAQVEQPPEEGLGEHALARIPLVGNRDEVRLVPASAELADEVVREDLGPAALERNLRRADGDPHRPAL